MKQQQKPGLWTHFAISLTIVADALSANITAKAAESFSVEVIGQGRPVLMIPGLMSDSRIWQPTAEALASQYQLHLISVAGFAGQPPVRGELLPRLQRELLNYIEQKQLQKPAIVGHSLGAFVAFALASTAPDKFGTIVAVDGLPYLAPVFSGDASTSVAQATPQAEYLRRLYQNMTPEQMTAFTRQGIARQATSDGQQQLILNMAAASDPATVGQAIYELLTTDLRSEVARIQSKVLLLGTSAALPDDTSRDNAKALYQQQLITIKHASLEFNPQARHFIMLDQPDWLTRRIASALQE
jgi:N-formylmaleamate deformylase